VAHELDVELLEDAAVLSDFLHTQYYAVLDKLWRRASQAVQDGVFHKPADEFEVQKGRFLGMQELINLPLQIIQMAAQARRAAHHASQV
jgi:hypothetical protein